MPFAGLLVVVLLMRVLLLLLLLLLLPLSVLRFRNRYYVVLLFLALLSALLWS